MYLRIMLFVVAVVVISFPVQWLLPKSMQGRRIRPRNYIMYDIAPLLGFFALLLLGLSLAEAARQQVLLTWALGGAAGMVAGVILWIAFAQSFRPNALARTSPSRLRLAISIVKTYGLLVLILLLGANIGTRWLGPPLQVFLAAALGMVVLISGLALFVQARRQTAAHN